MKPRTKLEKTVYSYIENLSALDEATEWAKNSVFEKTAYVRKTIMWCSECGTSWKDDDCILYYTTGGVTECPHCHAQITGSLSRKIKDEKQLYITIPETIKGFQVFRHVFCVKSSRMGNEAQYSFTEVSQEWINDKGKRVVNALPCLINGTWNLYQDMSLKQSSYPKFNCYYDIYSIDGFVYPGGKFLPELKKRGMSKKLASNCFLSKASRLLLLDDNDLELAIKTKQYKVFEYLIEREQCKIINKHAFNICNRNGYKILDAAIWFDYIELLTYFGKDTHNSYYVCPKQLKKEHYRLVKKKETAEGRKREEELLKRAAENEKLYAKQKGKYFGICFSDDDINVSVITSVIAMAEEGKAMHHCVFTNEYFLKNDSLILSARDKIGNRLETIEINLKTFKVVQSRAVCNGISRFHEQIVELVKRHMNDIIKKAKDSNIKQLEEQSRIAV